MMRDARETKAARVSEVARDAPATPAAPSTLRAWWLAARPRTLPVSLAPVLVGSAVAFADGRARVVPTFACWLGALCLQLAANFVNDYADHARGADDDTRAGPPRAAQQGWLSVRALRAGAALALVAAAGTGAYLVALGGWPIALAGALAMLCAWAYTGGPFPLGYHGLGELLVFAFFGVVAVTGTHWVQARAFSGVALACAVPMGLLACALLAVNNLRDRVGDLRAGKRTLATRFSQHGARVFAGALLLGSFPALALVGFTNFAGDARWLALPLLTLPIALRLAFGIARASGGALNVVLAGVARLTLLFAVLLALGLCAGR